jgi:hypothetical protein
MTLRGGDVHRGDETVDLLARRSDDEASRVLARCGAGLVARQLFKEARILGLERADRLESGEVVGLLAARLKDSLAVAVVGDDQTPPPRLLVILAVDPERRERPDVERGKPALQLLKRLVAE